MARAKSGLDRRKFLSAAAVAGAASLTPGDGKTAAPQLDAAPQPPSALPPSAKLAAAEAGTPRPAPEGSGVPASDFMVDVIRSLDIAYVPCNPAQSFRGLHESLIDY